MDLIYCVIIVVLSLQLPGLFLKGKDLSYLPAMRSLILYHLLFSVFYYFFTRNGGGDAWGYWKISRVMSSAEFMSSITEGEGPAFMEALNYIPASVLGMGYFVNFPDTTADITVPAPQRVQTGGGADETVMFAIATP